jgi:hypothetical protein
VILSVHPSSETQIAKTSMLPLQAHCDSSGAGTVVTQTPSDTCALADLITPPQLIPTKTSSHWLAVPDTTTAARLPDKSGSPWNTLIAMVQGTVASPKNRSARLSWTTGRLV